MVRIFSMQSIQALFFVCVFKYGNIKNQRLTYSNICSTNVYYKLMMYKALSETCWWDASPQGSVENLNNLTSPKWTFTSGVLRTGLMGKTLIYKY